MNQKKRTVTIFFGLLIGLIGLSTLWICRKVEQNKKDHALIAAIKAREEKKILEDIAEGASGEALDTGTPPTVREILRQLWDHLRHSDPPPSDQTTDATHLPALLLYMQLYYSYDYKGKEKRRVLTALLDHGACVDDRDNADSSALDYAMTASDADTVRFLLTRGANTEATNYYGDTPLMGADAAMTKILLERGANIEASNRWHWTPLLCAVMNDEPDTVRILLEHGAKVAPKDDTGQTAFDYILRHRTPYAPKIEALLRKYGAK